MSWFNGKYLTEPNPLQIRVNKLWDKYLIKFGYTKDTNVCSLPKEIYEKICEFISMDYLVEYYIINRFEIFVDKNGWHNDKVSIGWSIDTFFKYRPEYNPSRYKNG